MKVCVCLTLQMSWCSNFFMSILMSPLCCGNRLVEDSFELIVIIALCVTECFLVTLLLFHRSVRLSYSASFVWLGLWEMTGLHLVNWCWTCTCNRCICHWWGHTVGFISICSCRYSYPDIHMGQKSRSSIIWKGLEEPKILRLETDQLCSIAVSWYLQTKPPGRWQDENASHILGMEHFTSDCSVFLICVSSV